MYSLLSVIFIPSVLSASGQLPYPVVIVLYVIMAVMISAGVPVIVITRMLTSSNAMSEDITALDTYAGFVREVAYYDRAEQYQIEAFMEDYGKSPFADGDEGDGWKETDDIYGDLPEVDKPLFAPPRE